MRKSVQANPEAGPVETLEAMHNVAAAHTKAGDIDQSIRLFEDCLRIKRATFGVDDPSTLNTANALTNAYVDAGRIELALPLLQDAYPSNSNEHA